MTKTQEDIAQHVLNGIGGNVESYLDQCIASDYWNQDYIKSFRVSLGIEGSTRTCKLLDRDRVTEKENKKEWCKLQELEPAIDCTTEKRHKCPNGEEECRSRCDPCQTFNIGSFFEGNAERLNAFTISNVNGLCKAKPQDKPEFCLHFETFKKQLLNERK
jgi:hypothetical protein